MFFLLSLNSCGVPPISMMGEELGAEEKSEIAEQELSDSIVLVSPIEVFPKEVFDLLKDDFGKPVIVKEFPDKEIKEILSSGILVDLIMYRNDFAHKIFSRGLMQRLDLSKIENLPENLLELPFIKWGGYKTGTGPHYAVPYIVKNSGIILNNSLKGLGDISWNIFWDSNLKGKIGTDSLRDIIYISILLENIPFDELVENTEGTLYKIDDRCRELIDNGLVVYDNEDNLLRGLRSGEIDVAFIGEGSAYKFILENPNFRFAVPSEGLVGWVYNLSIPIRIKDEGISYRLINEMYDPSFASKIFKESGNFVLVPGVEEFLDGENEENFITQKNNFNSLIIFGNIGGKSLEKFNNFIDSFK